MEQHQQLIDGAAVEAHHQARQNQRDRRETFSPGDAKHQQPNHAGPGQRRELGGQHAAWQRPERRHGDAKLRAGRHTQRGRLGKRITQHLLKQHADQPKPRANEQRHRKARQQAVMEQHLIDGINIRMPQRLAPLRARQPGIQVGPAQAERQREQQPQQQRREQQRTLPHARPPSALSSTRPKRIAESVAP